MRTINSFVPLLVALTIAATTTHVPPARAASPELHYYATSLVRYAAKRSNVRAGPGTSYEKVGLLEAGEKVHVMAKTGNWFKLTPQGGAAERFVYAPLLAAARPESGTGAATTAASIGLVIRTITFNNGRYHGQTLNGKEHGRGVYTWTDGDRYEGEWRDGNRTGRGVYTWPNGNRYEGEWRDGNRTGRGTYTFADGDSYTQEWRGGEYFDVHRPEPTCLEVERVRGSFAYWINRCSVGIDLVWRDEGACQSRPGNKYPCGWFVGANKKVTAAIDGQVWWRGCESPGGIGDVLAIEKGDGVYCIGDGTARTVASKKRQRHGTQQALASARAAADAEHAREEAEWRRREEELERMRAAERQRREAEMWRQIRQHRQRTLENIRIMTGETQNQNSDTGSSDCRTSWGGVCNTE